MKHLFSFPSEAQSRAIEAVMLATERAVPIPSKHRHDLPFAIRDLSRLLTEERGSINRSYWASPRFFSAYAYYFLPWNLYRLAFILPSLDLRLKAGSRILDLGSGPLTLPLALWCARPDLRQMPLHFACADVAQRPLDGGRAIFAALAPESPWTIDLVRAPLDQAIGGSAAGLDCIMAGNVLNELVAAKGKPLEERIERLVRAATAKLSARGSLFFIEPGTRLGGKMVTYARKGALGAGLSVQAPCTHQNPCPMEAQQAYFSSAPTPSGWCHFTCPAHGAPAGLLRLGEQAGFQRYSLALSFALMHMTEAARSSGFSSVQAATPDPDFDLDALEALYELSMEDDDGQEAGGIQDTAWISEEKATDVSLGDRVQERVQRLVPPLAARIISGDIRLPGHREAARYACTEAGLALVHAAGRLPSGGDALVTWNKPEERDAKTGALVVWRVSEHEHFGYRDDRLPVRQQKDRYPTRMDRAPSSEGYCEGYRSDRDEARKKLGPYEKSGGRSFVGKDADRQTWGDKGHGNERPGPHKDRYSREENTRGSYSSEGDLGQDHSRNGPRPDSRKQGYSGQEALRAPRAPQNNPRSGSQTGRPDVGDQDPPGAREESRAREKSRQSVGKQDAVRQAPRASKKSGISKGKKVRGKARLKKNKK